MKKILKRFPLFEKLNQLRHGIKCIGKGIFKICVLKIQYPQLNIYTYKALINSIDKRNDTCHIIASGFSAVDSYKKNIVQKDDYIIGFNFAAFLPYQFDLYFCENGGINKISKALMTLLNKRADNMLNIVFKNIYSADISSLKIVCNNKIPFSMVFDIQLYNEAMYKKLFHKPSYFMPQYASTVVSSIMLAYHAGFKQIVVHGLDFAGPHLYHDDELQNQIDMEAPTSYVPLTKRHPTADSQELVWKKLIKCFDRLGVNIYSASESSGFCAYAPVYQAYKNSLQSL